MARFGSSVLLLGLALGCAGGSGSAPLHESEPAMSDEAAEAVAKQFVEALVAERFEDAAALLAPPIASRKTPADLQQRWAALTSAYGAPGALRDVRTEVQYGLSVVSGVLPFEKTEMKVKVVVDDEARVDDYFFSVS